MAPPPPPPPPPSQPQLHGVVIISLPPPDDPSKGKTITAFTLTDHYHGSHNPDAALPIQTLPSLPSSRPRRSTFSPKKAVGFFICSSVLIFSLWICLFTEMPYQLLQGPEEEARREEPKSFLFPLYPKWVNRTSPFRPDVKLGSIKLRTRQSNKLESSSSLRKSSAVFPIRGNVLPDGQYYTSIFIGNPPRPYFLDVDTGSDLTWIQCDAPCSSCAEGPHPLYKPTKGKIVPPRDTFCLEMQSNQNNAYCKSCQQCDYEIEYADHSTSLGVLTRDEMHIIENGDLTKLNFVFGCAYDQQGQLLVSPAKTDGILGLSSAKVSFPSQLASQGTINNVVGHCIRNEADGGGYMFLGDDFVPRWGMTWVHRQTSPTNFYGAEVSKVSYGDQKLDASGIQVIFDTGSSYTYFPSELYTNLIDSLNYIKGGLVQYDSDPTLSVCWRPNRPIRSLKYVKQYFEPLTLQFGKRRLFKSTEFTIPPENYLIISNEGNVCLGVLNGSEVHDGSSIIIGDNSLRGKLVVYDNLQQKLGWTQSDCTKPQRPKEFPFFF